MYLQTDLGKIDLLVHLLISMLKKSCYETSKSLIAPLIYIEEALKLNYSKMQRFSS